MNAVFELDARRLLCPMPVIRLQDCVSKQPAGSRVRVTCTDPGTLSDIPAWCRINGHQVETCSEIDDEYIFLVKTAPDGN